MLYYMSTRVPPHVITPVLRYYVDMFSHRQGNFLIDRYLMKTYGTTLSNALHTLINNCNVNSVKDDILQIYIDGNRYIGRYKLKDIAQFLEFGNLDIQSPRMISSIINNAIHYVRTWLGGI